MIVEKPRIVGILTGNFHTELTKNSRIHKFL